MEVLLTGGNGFVGRHLVAALLARGDRVRVLVLPDEDAGWLEERAVSVHRGDIRQPQTLALPMAGAQAVVHLAAMMDVWRPLADYRAVNVTGTENVCRAALAAGVVRLVHVSSSSVYGMGRGRTVDEDFPLRPFPDPYPVTKAEGDVLVRRLAAESGLPAVLLRPDQVFGPGDHLHFGTMADRLRSGRGIVIGDGSNRMPFVYVSDLVRALLLALDGTRIAGRAYNVSSEQPLTQAELLDAIADAVGARPLRLHLPYRALYAAGWAAERVSAFSGSGRRPPITRLGVAFFGTDNRYSIARAVRELGYRPQVPLREGIRETAAWYLNQRAKAEVAAMTEQAEVAG
jgi:nucleoside-diphosphate-sugar epimerase